MPSFYVKEMRADSTFVVLDSSETHHAVKVRRLREGDSLSLINGEGMFARGSLVHDDSQLSSSQVGVRIVEASKVIQPRPMLFVAAALPKGDRLKTMIDMLTQLGIAGFIPLDCERSVQKYSKNLADKLFRQSLEACKQADNAWLPQFTSAKTVKELVDWAGTERVGVISTDANGTALQAEWLNQNRCCCTVGPEGGFSQKELNVLKDASLGTLALTPTVLRTETAAVAAAALWIATQVSTSN